MAPRGTVSLQGDAGEGDEDMTRFHIGRRAAVTGMLATCAAGPVWAETPLGQLYTPARDTPERRAIMDAARVPIAGAVGLPVIFVVQNLNSDGHWAYLQAVPHNPDNSPIDWRGSALAREWEAGFMSDIAMVLLRRTGPDWHVVEWVMGPTDVAWIDWQARHDLPVRLFNRASLVK
jgi:hypothetical protein